MRLQNRINNLKSRYKKHSFVSTHTRRIKGYISFVKKTSEGNFTYTHIHTCSEAKACVRDYTLNIYVYIFPPK